MFINTEVKLKDGQLILLKPIRLKDTDARHNFFVELSLAQTGMVSSIEEIDFHNHETNDKIRDFLAKKRGLWLLAFDKQAQVVGEVDIIPYSLKRVAHNGLLTIGILSSHQGLGLGSILLSQILAWAQHQGLKRIELFVFKNNTRAQNLYKKFGFVVEGTRKNFLRHQDNTFEDDLLMAKYF